jgi:RsbRD-like negative regulator of sigma factor
MDRQDAPPLPELSRAKKGAIIDEWVARTLQGYPEQTGRFLSRERDPFRNPVGAALTQALPVILDAVLGGMQTARLTPALDSIVRIRAVQDFTPGQAVAFVFLLRPILRDALRADDLDAPALDALAALEGRIDAVALLAFEIYMKCRERLYEIRANEARRRIFVLERRHGLDPGADPAGTEAVAEPSPWGSCLP